MTTRLPVLGPPKFPCSRCGACCRDISHIPDLAHLVDKDGNCIHLRGEPGGPHECAIYDERPLVCRIDELKPEGQSVESWYAENEDACRWLYKDVYGVEMPEEDSSTG